MISTLIHIALLLLMPPLSIGVINKTKAFFAGRVGQPLLQPYYDLAKLFRKRMVLSETTSWVFAAGPVVSAVAVLATGLLVPFGPARPPVGFVGDIILFVYLLGLARFFTMAAALDTGSAFEGMGAAREATFAFLAEPALLLGMMVCAVLSHSMSLAPMLHGAAGWHGGAVASIALTVMGLFVVLLAENCRIPVDDPNTHLELTMIHEVMVLDHGGPLLGLVLYGAWMKLFVMEALVLTLALPFRTGSIGLDVVLFVSSILTLAVAVGVVESVMARLRMRHVPYLLTAAIIFCGLGFLLALR